MTLSPKAPRGRRGLAVALGLGAFLLAGVAAAEPKVLARIDGAPITEDDVNDALEDIGPGLPQKLDGPARQQYALDYLIDMKLVAKKAAADKLDASPAFARRLAYYHDKLEMEALLTDVAAKAATEEAEHKAYDEAAKANPPVPEIHARHILLPTEQEAKAALARVKKGEDFAKVATELSKDPGGEGGDLGWFTKDKMVPEFAEAAFKLEPGQISEPVKSQFGWHIIKVEEKRMKTFPPFDQVKEQAARYVVQKAQSDLIVKLHEGVKIERTEEAKLVAPGLVAIPDDISCSVEGASYTSTVGKNGEMDNTSGSVKGVTCWMSGKTPQKKKEIALASTAITGGMVKTKDFGDMQLSPENNVNTSGFQMAVSADKVQSLREYLQK